MKSDDTKKLCKRWKTHKNIMRKHSRTASNTESQREPIKAKGNVHTSFENDIKNKGKHIRLMKTKKKNENK